MLLRILFVLCFSLDFAAAMCKYSVITPNVLNVGEDHTVLVQVRGVTQNVGIKVSLEDWKRKPLWSPSSNKTIIPGTLNRFTVRLDPGKLKVQTAVAQYVNLFVASNDSDCLFSRGPLKIRIGFKNGLLLVQTDKPIYTPKQRVQILVFPLGFNLKPKSNEIKLVIQNPQNVRVKEWIIQKPQSAIISEGFELAEHELEGSWTVTASYGQEEYQKTPLNFEVKKYVLPKFSVKIEVPPYILNTDDKITVKASSRYVYNKPVDGYIRVDMKVVRGAMQPIPFSTNEMLLDDGEASVTVLTADVKRHPAVQGFPEGGRLLVVASVFEATGVKEMSTDSSAVFTSTPYKIKFINTRNHFLPGLPFTVNVAVMYATKKPAGKVPMVLKVVAYNKDKKGQDIRGGGSASYETNNDGHVSFRVDVPRDTVRLDVRVSTNNTQLKKDQNGETRKEFGAFHSSSERCVMLRQKERAKVGGTLICDVILRARGGDDLVYFVVARGQILEYHVKKIDKMELSTISIKVTADMSPSARLVAYTIVTNSGEVVSDSILLDVEDQFPTEVAFRDPGDPGNGVVSVFPADHRMITVKAPPNTTVAVMAVDKSVYLLNNENRLTPSRVFKQIEGLDLGCGVGGGGNSRDVFRNAGVLMVTEKFWLTYYGDLCSTGSGARRRRSTQSITDLSSCCDMGKEQDARSCARRYLDLDNFEFACRKEFLRCCNETFGSRDMGILARSFGDGEESSQADDLELALSGNTRSYFPELWFYSEKVTNSKGIAEWPVTIPDTITTWVAQAVGVDRNTGFGMAKPLNLVAFQSFFVSLKLPYSAQRGEQVAITATVFNYGEISLKLRLYLEQSGQFCSVSRGSDHQQIATLTLKPGDAQSASFPIVPKQVGTISIKVIAAGGIHGNDKIEKKLLVLNEGVERREVQSFRLDQSKQGSSRSISLRQPPNAVPGSVKAKIYLNGDVMTPLVTSLVHDNMEDLLRLPTGCGEQTASKMSFSVYILTYLKRTNQLSDSPKKKAADYIQEGFSREVSKFRNADGSFAIRSGGSGLIWLTAFVRKIFCQAWRLHPITGIDIKVVCQAGEWISSQQKSDGSFAYSRWPFSSSEGRTAFVLIALQECSDLICSSANVNESITRAQTFLEGRISQINSIHDLAVTTYALAITTSSQRFTANNRLIQRAVNDSASKTRHWLPANLKGSKIETTGYALLAQLALGRLHYAGPIVTWLTAMQNAQGAFQSTHDTSIALQALSKYSEMIAGKDQGLDLTIAMNVANTANKWRLNRQITKQNRLLQIQESANSILGETILVKSSGSGEAQMLVELRYNKYTTRNESCSFDVDVSVETPKQDTQGDDSRGRTPRNTRETDNGKCYRRRSKDKTCTGRIKGPKMSFRTCCRKKKGEAWSPGDKNRKICKVCKKDKPLLAESMDKLVVNVSTRYRGNDSNAGMGIVDVGIFTGYTVDKASLDKIKNMTEVDIIETSDRKVVFYLSEIPSNRTIWMSLHINRENDVGSVQPVPVNVYNYDEPSKWCTKFYGPSKGTSLPKALCSPKECVCSQDNCAFKEPPDIRNKRLIQRQVCKKYRYAFKGQAVYLDESNGKDNYFITYAVKVGRIFKKGKNIEETRLLHFMRKVTCKAPVLEKGKHYVFMGIDDINEIDENSPVLLNRDSWVRHWPDSGKVNKALEEIFGTITSATCKPGP